MLVLDSSLYHRALSLLTPLLEEPDRKARLAPALSAETDLYYQVDWDGSAQVFTVHLVELCARYGRLQSGEQALVVVARTLGGYVGEAEQAPFAELQELLQALPDAPQESSPQRAGLPPAEQLPEPGELPPGSRMLFPRNPLFTGREKELLALAKLLFYPLEPGKARLPVIVVGLPGVGKSQLAVELCYRYGRFLQGVFWVQAAQEFGDIASEVAACGTAMGGPYAGGSPWPEKTPERVALTLRTWQERAQGGERLLLALDNLEDPVRLAEWLPSLGGLHLLVTSRLGRWPKSLPVSVFKLPVLTRDESRLLLRRLAGRLETARDSEVDPIARRFGDLPLGLHVAGSYIAAGDLDPGDYLKQLQATGGALKQAPLPDWLADNPLKRDLNLWSTFQMSWSNLAGQAPPDNQVPQAGAQADVDAMARTLFLTCGYLAPNMPIPIDLLKMVAQEEGINFQLALQRLYTLGLLSEGEAGAQTPGPVIHPLLAEFARLNDAPGNDSALFWLAIILEDISVRVLLNGLPELFRPLRAHLEAAAEWEVDLPVPFAGTLWNGLAWYLQETGDYTGALAAIQKALAYDEAAVAIDHHFVGRDLNTLGQLYHLLNRLEEARQAFERAGEIIEAKRGDEHAETAAVANNLGSVLLDLQDYDAARQAFEKARRIWQSQGPIDWRNLAKVTGNLGWAYYRLGDLAGALAAFDEALQLSIDHLEEGHPDIGLYLLSRGIILADQGDFPPAQESLEQALAILSGAFGEVHPEVARLYVVQGKIKLLQGDRPGAEQLYRRALAIDTQLFGAEDRRTVDIQNMLNGL